MGKQSVLGALFGVLWLRADTDGLGAQCLLVEELTPVFALPCFAVH